MAHIDGLIDGVALSLAEQAAARLTPTQSEARDTRKIQVPSAVDVGHAYVRAPTDAPAIRLVGIRFLPRPHFSLACSHIRFDSTRIE